MENWHERFDGKVRKQEDGCWIWTGALMTGGYGGMSVAGRMRLAHRLAYERENGPIPAHLEIDHKCRVRACVNPEHLEAVPHSENTRRGTKARLGGVPKIRTTIEFTEPVYGMLRAIADRLGVGLSAAIAGLVEAEAKKDLDAP